MVIKPNCCLVVALLTLSPIIFGKEVPLSEKSARMPDYSEKSGQIGSESIIDNARYLRWHRNAMAQRARPHGLNASPHTPYLQL